MIQFQDLVSRLKSHRDTIAIEQADDMRATGRTPRATSQGGGGGGKSVC
jgi:hypothetical protein